VEAGGTVAGVGPTGTAEGTGLQRGCNGSGCTPSVVIVTPRSQNRPCVAATWVYVEAPVSLPVHYTEPTAAQIPHNFPSGPCPVPERLLEDSAVCPGTTTDVAREMGYGAASRGPTPPQWQGGARGPNRTMIGYNRASGKN